MLFPPEKQVDYGGLKLKDKAQLLTGLLWGGGGLSQNKPGGKGGGRKKKERKRVRGGGRGGESDGEEEKGRGGKNMPSLHSMRMI